MPPSVSTTIGLRRPGASGIRALATSFEHGLGVGECDPLDRALADRETVVLLELGARLREGLIGGEVDDDALQRPRIPMNHLRPEHERTHPLRPEPILRLPDLYFAKFRMPAEFFHPGDASEGVDESPDSSPPLGSRPNCAAPPVPEDASPPPSALPLRRLPSIPPRRLQPPARSMIPACEAWHAPAKPPSAHHRSTPSPPSQSSRQISPNRTYSASL